MTTVPSAADRAGSLAQRLEFAFVFRGGLDLTTGGVHLAYRSTVDPRVTMSLRRARRRSKTVRTYCFADDGVYEVERLYPPLIGDEGREFAALDDLALAIIAHDDERAWQRAWLEAAPPEPRKAGAAA